MRRFWDHAYDICSCTRGVTIGESRHSRADDVIYARRVIDESDE